MIFTNGLKVAELPHSCFFQELEYYKMSKVFAKTDSKIYYIDHADRSQVIEVNISQPGYSYEIISFKDFDLFEIAVTNNQHDKYKHQGEDNSDTTNKNDFGTYGAAGGKNDVLIAVSENSGWVSFYCLRMRKLIKRIQLTTDKNMVFRTIASNGPLTVINGIHNEIYTTKNTQFVISNIDFEVITQNYITFDGGHLGKYIHNIEIVYYREVMPLILMVSHHYEDAHFYAYGLTISEKKYRSDAESDINNSKNSFSRSRKYNMMRLTEIKNLHKRWIWDIEILKDKIYVASSDGFISVLHIEDGKARSG